MSIVNSLKTFSKKAFNVEPKGSNVDEVLDDMASNVTPGSGGSDASSIGYTFSNVILFNGEVEEVTRDGMVCSMIVENLTIPKDIYPVVILDNEEIRYSSYDLDDSYIRFLVDNSGNLHHSLKWTFAENKLELLVRGEDQEGTSLTHNIVVYYEGMTNISPAFKGMIKSIINEYNAEGSQI